MTKSELRRSYLARQRALTPAERKDKSLRITEHFFRNIGLSQIRILHCFIAIDKFNEVQTDLIFRRLWRDYPAVETTVPRVNFSAGEIENLRFASETDLVENPWKIHEPVHDEYVETESIDMVIVPLLCFDERGYRVGFGKGFYDKLLAKCRPDCQKIGLSYFPPIERIDDADIYDIRLDLCVTPESVFDVGEKTGAAKT